MEAGFLDVNLEEVDIENSVSIPTSMWMRQGVVESIYMDGLKDSVRYFGAKGHKGLRLFEIGRAIQPSCVD
jgi:hypothetical protein